MDENMVRTQIYLPRDMYAQLRARTTREGVSMAEQVREAVGEYLARADNEETILREDSPIWQIVGDGEGPDDGDGSINHDHYLYGWPRREE